MNQCRLGRYALLIQAGLKSFNGDRTILYFGPVGIEYHHCAGIREAAVTNDDATNTVVPRVRCWQGEGAGEWTSPLSNEMEPVSYDVLALDSFG